MARYFSWNAYWTYTGCPARYRKIYITQTPVTKVLDHYYLIYGSIIHELVETFYKDKLWKLKKDCSQKLEQLARVAFAQYIKKKTVLWDKPNYLSKSELLEDLLACIPKVLEAIKEHKLLSSNIQVELPLRAKLADFTVGGRADLLITKPEGLFLIDGKSAKKFKPEHNLQLIYYTLCYYLSKRVIPKFVGIWYFRDAKIKWLEISKTDLKELRDDIIKVKHLIREGVFPKATTKNPCFWCDYNNVCGKSRDHLETIYGSIDEAYM